MTRIFIGIALVALLQLTACVETQDNDRRKPRSNRFGAGAQGTDTTTSTVVTDQTDTTTTTQTTDTTPPPPPPPPPPGAQTTSQSQPVKDHPYGKPVPGKTGFVISPFSENSGYIDVRGFPPSTPVKDPYTGQIFLVP